MTTGPFEPHRTVVETTVDVVQPLLPVITVGHQIARSVHGGISRGQAACDILSHYGGEQGVALIAVVTHAPEHLTGGVLRIGDVLCRWSEEAVASAVVGVVVLDALLQPRRAESLGSPRHHDCADHHGEHDADERTHDGECRLGVVSQGTALLSRGVEVFGLWDKFILAIGHNENNQVSKVMRTLGEITLPQGNAGVAVLLSPAVPATPAA